MSSCVHMLRRVLCAESQQCILVALRHFEFVRWKKVAFSVRIFNERWVRQMSATLKVMRFKRGFVKQWLEKMPLRQRRTKASLQSVCY
uniref:Uncharacterized protein n=1 Tax=Parascaris univalens TaxID=6257 RepID=A0A915A0E4_PARUN